MYYVYILKSKNKNWIYTGYTEDLKKRFKEHNNGLSKATKPYLPLELIFYEAFKSKKLAKSREKYFKTTKGKRTLNLMLGDDLK